MLLLKSRELSVCMTNCLNSALPILLEYYLDTVYIYS